MGTHPIFESDFDCLTDSVHALGYVGRSESRVRLPRKTVGAGRAIRRHGRVHAQSDRIRYRIGERRTEFAICRLQECRRRAQVKLANHLLNRTKVRTWRKETSYRRGVPQKSRE